MRFLVALGVFVGAIASWAALISPTSAKISTIEGRVLFVLKDAQGRPDGIVLNDRTVVLFHAESLHDARPPSIGDKVNVRGYLALHKPNWVLQQSAITDRGRIILDETQTANPASPYSFETPGQFVVLKKAQVRAPVFAFVARGTGDLDRVVLNDGTLVQVSSGGFVDEKRLKLGETVNITGIGTDSKQGRYVEAMSMKDPKQFELIITSGVQGSDQESWMTVEGKIAQTLLTPRGMVDGVVLGNHSAIRFRPVPVTDASPLKLGTQVEAAGAGKENQVFSGSLLVVPNGRKAIGLSTSASALQPTPEPSRDLDRMYDRGQILTVLKDAYGDPETLVLTDGTSIQVPPDLRHKLDFFPRAGETVSAEGYGGKYDEGTAIRASSLRRNTDADQPA